MGTSEKIKNELQALLDEEKSLIELVKTSQEFFKFGTSYQGWYSRACKVVEILGSERLEEFMSYYRIDPKRDRCTQSTYVIQDYIMHNRLVGLEGKNLSTFVMIRITNQMQILASLKSRIDNVLQDVTGHLLADIQDSELKVADQLRKVSLKAAGALAGVILEGHLQRVTQNHNISIRKKSPTIADLNDPLKNKGVYDNPTWRKIQYLADIRNLCSHKKDQEPTNDEVVELISGVNWVIKSIF
jgi:hypothetical protein